jgi:hypothetical protein
MLVIFKEWGVFQDKQNKKMSLNPGKILKENLIQSAFHQTLRHEFSFQQHNNLKHWSCLPRE